MHPLNQYPSCCSLRRQFAASAALAEHQGLAIRLGNFCSGTVQLVGRLSTEQREPQPNLSPRLPKHGKGASDRKVVVEALQQVCYLGG